MEIELRCLGERAPEMFGQLNGEVSNLLPFCLNFVDKVETSRQVNNGTAQRLVHRNNRFTVAIDPGLVPQRLDKCLAKSDRNVFNRMVIINLEVTIAAHVEIKQSVFGKQLKHVIEKW